MRIAMTGYLAQIPVAARFRQLRVVVVKDNWTGVSPARAAKDTLSGWDQTMRNWAEESIRTSFFDLYQYLTRITYAVLGRRLA